MANYTVTIICTEPSDAKSLFHWESASLKPHLPVNKLNLQVFFSKYYIQKIKKIYMISTFCSISHLNLKAVYIAPRDFCTPLLIDVSDRGLKLHAQMQLCKYNNQYGAKRRVWFYITK